MALLYKLCSSDASDIFVVWTFIGSALLLEEAMSCNRPFPFVLSASRFHGFQPSMFCLCAHLVLSFFRLVPLHLYTVLFDHLDSSMMD